MFAVPSATTTVVSSLLICNRGGTPTTFRVSVAVAGASDTAAQYLWYDLPIGANDTFIAGIGMTLAATDVVRVYAGNANCSVTLFGVESS